jgi:hypothetical protein
MITLPITADDITEIVAIDDPVLRNLWITQSYADFADRLRTAIDPRNHTWCGFAVWASATAGQSIREEELPAIVGQIITGKHEFHIDAVNDELQRHWFLRFLKRLEHVHLVDAIRGALDTVRDHIAHGNTLVYAELAPLFVAFLERLDAGEPTEEQMNSALDAVATDPIDDGLREAFHWYWQASRATDDAERVHAILAGNVLAVAHEQERLQDDIAASLGSGVLTAEQVLAELLPRWVPDVLAKLIRGSAATEVQRLLDDLWDSVTTELLMTLRVPGATLRLSADVPVGPGGMRFPAALSTLSDVPPDSVFRSWDLTDGTGVGDAASDWARLRERMNYIVNLFRSRQQDPSLAAAPFSPEQVATMQSGQVPSGPLLPTG